MDWSAEWAALWQQLGAKPPQGCLPRLLQAYAEPHRHYHTERHLQACLLDWRRWSTEATHPQEVALALWFHDAVYDPVRHDNEAQSVQLLQHMLVGRLDDTLLSRVANLILATCHQHAPTNGDTALLLDVDLAILGAESAAFAEYERQVRAEYAWVPEEVYQQTRRGLMQRWLAAPRIYHTQSAGALEQAARRNLQHWWGQQASDMGDL